MPRVRAVVGKELRDYRRKRSIVVTMCILPALFLIQPTLTVFLASPDPSKFQLLQASSPAPPLDPGHDAFHPRRVLGCRRARTGTLEPLLTTPIRRQEFILGKAAAVMIPTLVLSYAVIGLFLVVVWLFAKSVVATDVFHQGPVLLALMLFTPLLAGWAIVVGMAVSVRASEVRVAQQLGTVASLPPLGVVVLFGIGVIHPTFTVAVLFAAALLVIDLRALRVVSRMFDRERLVTGSRAADS